VIEAAPDPPTPVPGLEPVSWAILLGMLGGCSLHAVRSRERTG
jgi:hypothetical protein